MTPTTTARLRAFTLIELLIVVAIIAILAAIAVPNFLEAQTRSKISRTKSDMRTYATALEAYVVDYNSYPNSHANGVAFRLSAAEPRILERLTTPISYVTSIGRDPFTIRQRNAGASCTGMIANFQSDNLAELMSTEVIYQTNSYIYQAWNSEQRYVLPPDGFSDANKPKQGKAWLLHSAGPDGVYFNLGGVLANDNASQVGPCTTLIYDATNGSLSYGSIFRANGSPGASPTYAAGEALLMAIRTQQ